MLIWLVVFFNIAVFFMLIGHFEVLKVISIELHFKSALQKHMEKSQMYKTDFFV